MVREREDREDREERDVRDDRGDREGSVPQMQVSSAQELERVAIAERLAHAPAPGEAELPAANVLALLKRNGTDPAFATRPALRFGDRVWTHAELLGQSLAFADFFRSRLAPDRPPHVGVLLDNTPDYVFALCGAGLCGAVVVGLNHTRRGEHLVNDIAHTDVQMLVTEPRHEQLLEPVIEALDLPGGLYTSTRFADEQDPPVAIGESLDKLLGDSGDSGGSGQSGPDRDVLSQLEAHEEPDVEALWVLLFTSGTSAAPKAVRCTQRRLLTTGNRMTIVLDVGPDDIGYVAMPLFHSNSLMVGLAPALVAGASVGLARRFSASRFLDDVRRYGATWFNYTGKPLAYLLATPERPDDAENPLRLAYGNEGSPHVVEEASRRFGVSIVDVFGATEGAIALDRAEGPPRGSVGRAREGIKVVDQDGNELERAVFDDTGRLTNAEACVGELVNAEGLGPFEGYYRNEEAMARSTRFGWYWSGDLGYIDSEGWVYFAGRTSDWLRVDGENFPAAPIEAIISRHPDVMLVSVYGVPDADAGDQVMATLVLREGSAFDPEAFSSWVDARADLSPKWRPRYVRISEALPTTPTNKVLVRTLVHQKFRSDRTGGDPIYTRGRGEPSYRVFDAETQRALESEFAAAGRSQAWDL